MSNLEMTEILVVDDDQSILEPTGRILRRHGYGVSLFAEPFAAITLLKENPCRFGAILMDWKLRCPIDGDSVVKAIKHFFPAFDVPIVFATAYAHFPDPLKHLMRVGAYDVLIKPFSEDQLIDAIERALKKKPEVDPHLNVPTLLDSAGLKKQEIAKRTVAALTSTRNVTEAAASLGCSRATLYRWLKLTGLRLFFPEKEL